MLIMHLGRYFVNKSIADIFWSRNQAEGVSNNIVSKGNNC